MKNHRDSDILELEIILCVVVGDVFYHPIEALHICWYQAFLGAFSSLRISRRSWLGILSAGCVRMSFIDEKWLSKTCPKGTKVVVYSSKQSGPLGKPKAVTFNKKVNVKKKWLYYDPTDPIKGNKGYNLKAPKIRIDADDEVKQGEVFDPKSGVTAKDERSFQDLTERIKYKIYKKEETTNDEGEPAESWERVSIVSTQNAGEEYKIKYSCYYKYCSKYTGKKTRYITIEGEEPDENEEQQDWSAQYL